jgi:DNA-binding XRE family transcriptional regulator
MAEARVVMPGRVLLVSGPSCVRQHKQMRKHLMKPFLRRRGRWWQMVLASVVTVDEQTVTTLELSRDKPFLYMCSILIELLIEVMFGLQETLFSNLAVRVTNKTAHMP